MRQGPAVIEHSHDSPYTKRSIDMIEEKVGRILVCIICNTIQIIFKIEELRAKVTNQLVKLFISIDIRKQLLLFFFLS